MLASLLPFLLSAMPPDSAKLGISVDHQEICAYDPLFVRVALVHQGPEPLLLPRTFAVDTGDIGFERRFEGDEWRELAIPGAGMRCFHLLKPIPVPAKVPLVTHEMIFLLAPKDSGVWAAFPRPGLQEIRAYMTWGFVDHEPARIFSPAIRLAVRDVPPIHARHVYENCRVLAVALEPYDCLSDKYVAKLKTIVPTLEESRLRYALECKLLQWELLNSAGDGPPKTLDRLEAFAGAENVVLRESLLLGLARSYLYRRRFQESLDTIRRIQFDSISMRSVRIDSEFFVQHHPRGHGGNAEPVPKTHKQPRDAAPK